MPTKNFTDTIPLEKVFDLKEQIFSAAKINNLSIAFWKLPNIPLQHCIIDTSGNKSLSQFSFETHSRGFIIHPFNSVKESSYFINGDLYFNSDSDNIISSNSSPSNQYWKEKLLNELLPHSPLTHGIRKATQFNLYKEERENYVDLVKKAITKIRTGSLKKVVTARFKTIPMSKDFSATNLFERLCEKFPSAFVSLIFHPETGCWLGASPELLASITEEKKFNTTALAGTQKVSTELNPCKISWNHKEIEEQALVSRYIVHCFKSLKINKFEENGPRTVFTGNLAHLKTDFTIDIKNKEPKNIMTSLLQLLHPTSAVGGMPREVALDFLKKEEGFERSLYAGYLGPVNIAQRSDIYVNIRCAKFQDHEITFYAGAGITEESDPEKEWLETEAKIQAIMSCVY